MRMFSDASTSFSLMDTLVLLGVRVGLFFACQRFVLGALSHQLDTTTAPDDDIELETLPTPSVSGSHSSLAHKESRRSTLARTVFSLSFSESCVLFILLMSQATGIFTSGSRLLHWKISLFILLSMLMVVVPVSLSLFTSSSYLLNCLPGPSRVLPLIVYFALLSYVPLPSALAIPDENAWFTATFARLVVLGVILLGVLSGYGSVTTAWGYFPFLCGPQQKVITVAQIRNAQESLARVQDELNRKRQDVTTHERKQQNEDAKQLSWLSRVTPNFGSGNELTTLKTELTALSALERNMFAEVERLQSRHAALAFDETWTGRLFILFRRAMGIYCLLRGATSIMNLVIPSAASTSPTSTGYPDILTSFLTSFISLLPFDPVTLSALETQVPTVLRQINLAVVGIIILSSLRRVLVALHVLRRGRGTSAGGTLVLTQVMGIYFLSTLIQLRTSFPQAQDSDNLFATLPEYQLFGPVFDASFLVAAAVAGGAEWLRSKAAADDSD